MQHSIHQCVEIRKDGSAVCLANDGEAAKFSLSEGARACSFCGPIKGTKVLRDSKESIEQFLETFKVGQTYRVNENGIETAS